MSSGSRARRSTGSPRPASSSWAQTPEPAEWRADTRGGVNDDDVASDHHGLGRHARRGSGAGGDARRRRGDGLVGTTWHTVRIDGDALFFVIKDVGIRFEDQGRFVAAVRFIDGQQTSKTGTYRVVKPGTILLTIEGLGNAKQVQFRRQGRDLDRPGPGL